jgi:hypothetical protein
LKCTVGGEEEKQALNLNEKRKSEVNGKVYHKIYDEKDIPEEGRGNFGEEELSTKPENNPRNQRENRGVIK